MKKLCWAIEHVIFATIKPAGPLKIGVDFWLMIHIALYGALVKGFHEYLAPYWYYIVIMLLFVAAVRLKLQDMHWTELEECVAELASMRYRVVEIREKLFEVVDPDGVEIIRKELEDWKQAVKKKMASITKSGAERWALIGDFKGKLFKPDLPEENRHLIAVYTEFENSLKDFSTDLAALEKANDWSLTLDWLF